MEDSHKAALIAILVLIIIALASMIVASLVFDSVESNKVLEKNITVIGKICGEKTLGTTTSSIQDNEFIVYSTTNDDCKRYEIGQNYTIKYNNIRSSLSGINYNIMSGV